jgi:hypothetical protein
MLPSTGEQGPGPFAQYVPLPFQTLREPHEDADEQISWLNNHLLLGELDREDPPAGKRIRLESVNQQR